MLKYTKYFKIKINSTKFSKKNLLLTYGNCGFKACASGRMTVKQIELIRKILLSTFHRRIKIWFFIFPNNILTKKPKEVRMGKGKGAFFIVICCITKGKIIFEFLYKKNVFHDLDQLFKKIQNLV